MHPSKNRWIQMSTSDSERTQNRTPIKISRLQQYSARNSNPDSKLKDTKRRSQTCITKITQMRIVYLIGDSWPIVYQDSEALSLDLIVESWLIVDQDSESQLEESCKWDPKETWVFQIDRGIECWRRTLTEPKIKGWISNGLRCRSRTDIDLR